MRMLSAVMFVFCFAGRLVSAQNVGMLYLESNAKEYHYLYHDELRNQLAAAGLQVARLTEKDCREVAGLRRYQFVVASSTYITPPEVRKTLEDFVVSGGVLFWVDGPARAADDKQFLKLMGVDGRPNYIPGEAGTLRISRPSHPAALGFPKSASVRFVGNPFTQAVPGATVVAFWEQKQKDTTRRIPVLIWNRYGKGTCVLFNAIPWRSRPMLALLRSALMAATVISSPQKGSETLLASVDSASREFAQPKPLTGTICCIAATRPLPPTVRLQNAKKQTVVEQRLTGWDDVGQFDDKRLCARARFTLPTRGLPDGSYTLLAKGEGTVHEIRVRLIGGRIAKAEARRKARMKTIALRLKGTLATYDRELRTPDGRFDIPRMIQALKAAHIQTYDFLIWHAKTDFDDLKRFAPEAKKAGISLWVTLCPPSEQGGSWPYSEPFKTDFVRWAKEIGKLAREAGNIHALVIDDFDSHANQKLFTSDYVLEVAEALRTECPDVAFLPTIYWRTISNDKDWINRFGPAVDGIVYPYANLASTKELPDHLRAARKMLGPDRLLFVNVYATGSSGQRNIKPRTPEYMRSMLQISHEQSDGIRIYCLPLGDPNNYLYRITSELFGKWIGK